MSCHSKSTMQNPHERFAALQKQIEPRPARSTMRSSTSIIKNWKFAQQCGNAEETKMRPTATFPTDVYSDLLAQHMIPNPFSGMNEQEVQWVAERAWKYQTTFQTPIAVASAEKTVLVFQGLDTFATVTLNGKIILSSHNMFVRHEVTVTNFLRPAKEYNILEIVFVNAVKKAEAIMEKYPNHKWGTMGGDARRTAVRKAQYHFGWDWGPRLITCGPWKPISMEIYDTRITDLSYQTSLDRDLENADIEASLEIDGFASSAIFEIVFDGEVVAQVEEPVKHDSTTVSTKLEILGAKLWWPFTHGLQPLYTLTAHILRNGVRLDSFSCRVGIRKVELVQKPLNGQDGSSFFFRINNVSMFSSGSCWIPADSLTTRITPQKYREWIKLARSGNQSMIRVWGGGIFEHDAFYDACDEIGVLVWQDFMFACGNYPTYTAMLESIKTEAEQNVKRLRNHPSIVLWAGNNEDYLWVLLGQLEYDTDDKDPQSWLTTSFPARYIYEFLLPKICEELIPAIPYHPGSPFGGALAIDPMVGDIHQWGVWHLDQAPYQNYPEMGGRFVSEFGMQALPTRETVDQYFTESQRKKLVKDEVLKWHNKSDGAEDRLERYLTSNLPDFDREDLDAQIYHTQLIQAEAHGTAFRSWRRDWRGPGKEYCAGALLWQLNDCWPGTSWAIADFYLRPKLAFWAVKRECAQLTAGMKRTAEGIETWAVNMTLMERVVDVTLKMWDARTGMPVNDTIIYKGVVLPANQSTELSVVPLPAGALSRTDIVVGAYIFENGVQRARHINFHEPLKEVTFQTPRELSCKIISHEQDGAMVTLSSEIPVKGLFLTIKGEGNNNVSLDDNGVDLVPGEIVRLGVRGLNVGDERRLTLTWLGGSKSY